MNIHEKLELNDCPYCGGAGLLEEENGWCWYVMCLDCGSQTAAFEYKTPDERFETARKAATMWNIGKVLRGNIGE
ncbi:MAG: Lar family restriction alleviation protein [Oscillospiraceae bacterium]|jgi:hypothetical protein|nr:Lar family restriction alleviation protein [Oscillospiraceae bacterium]